MPKPIFVLLHGAWHTPRCWDRLIAQLYSAGFTSVAPALPSSGSSPPTPDWSQDVENIRDTVSKLVQDNDVVVVAHSFSGMTGGTALEGLDKATTLSKGLKGGVIRMIYIAAFLVPEGFQHSPRGTRDNMVPEMKTDFEVCQLPSHCNQPSLTISDWGDYCPSRRRKGIVLSGCRRHGCC